MLDKFYVANYILSLDKEKKYFTKELINRNGRTFYEGNARLNKIMHLSQNIYLAKTGTLLIDADFYAYDNGAVIPEIQNNYSRIISQEYLDDYTNMTEEEKNFLTKMFVAFSCAPIDELIEIDHEDNEWIAKSVGKTLKEQRMDTFSRKKEYEIQYADIIKVLDRMVMFI
ncbi:MAG: DUF4065 domain-containing protein [Lachnospiraceae bacterium]|nr:DUF4065 domain-containing protein [Lachnospiraceae bacterium]